MKALIAALALPAGMLIPASSHSEPMRLAPKPRCASIVIAQQTVTGHEADLPITLCGLTRKGGSWTCDVTPWGPFGATSKLDCTRNP